MTHTQRKTRLWRRVVLIVSLALNLIVVGAVVGALIVGGPRGGGARFDLTVGPLTRAMEEPQRDALRGALRDSGVFRPADRREMRMDMRRMLDILRAQTFARDDFEALLVRQRARLRTGQEAAVFAIVDIIADMPAAERAAFADRLSEQMSRRLPAETGRDDRSGG